MRAHELTADDMKLSCIRNALYVNVSEYRIPNLNNIQNFVTHLLMTELNSTDNLDVNTRIVKDKVYRNEADDIGAFSFSCNLETAGQMYVIFTTKRMLMRMDRYPKCFTFHFDATSSIRSTIRPLSEAFQIMPPLRVVFASVVENLMGVCYIMGDADGTQYNAIEMDLKTVIPIF
ncbi:hypothetical protein GN244_ATG04704 [Phytophthora infestans]|uniref:MULE transposase domain-containing protein n=1 Tax=Phytophthora infestans TaxID=4787 RepID=A0A833WIF2_PHYIN|nr:hypothetical protein GN244_ATG04704 [Phytophthora infestans]